jgi:hypothetical protein
LDGALAYISTGASFAAAAAATGFAAATCSSPNLLLLLLPQAQHAEGRKLKYLLHYSLTSSTTSGSTAAARHTTDKPWNKLQPCWCGKTA